ncbi:hypothetical protein FVEN_g3713 [Fusarium venenatum]|uniref:Zn(2)-C6 fungal-type domain-containing protein n=1 Tax=Fusarium venenatum TaxID=56646 RepID=A0A2L2SRQ6_9HYPO|nr:uncharacterized protein FVRRES_13675 [Fusarium venenatum]KAG8358647.1 hypothetical protein FVEN_g3713 [Fusarium venenatum]CEI41646.1 unnamed protein product [Fusarium venenatum]
MPRPKVRDEDRRRATKACVPCQNSKKKCDAQSPCANCRRRNCIAYCIYDPEVARRRRQGIKAHRRETHPTRDTFSSGGSDGGHYNDDPMISHDLPSPIDGNHLRGQAHVPQTPESTQEPQSHTTPDTSSCMSNISSQEQRSEGKKDETTTSVSMGDSPSLSFLDFLRHTFHHYMGPTPFTDKERAEAMLEPLHPRPPGGITPNSELTLEEKQDYIQRFLIATTGIIYIYSPEQMLEMLEETEENRRQNPDASESSSSYQKSAVIDLAIAIGGQGCRTTPKSLYHAQKHFDRGQKLAFEEMLLDPTSDLVATFMMMTVYLMNACKRKGAFIYLGVATRLAYAIGLHLPESYNNLAPKIHRFRLQVWKSLRILEIAIGSVLGQLPSSSPGQASVTPSFSIPDGSEPWSPEFTSMSSTYGVCIILEQIIHRLDSKQDNGVESIRDLLSRLRDWSSALPSSMRKCTVSSPISLVQRRQVLGNFAVSGFYYYSVMLATRPLLVSYMLMKLKRLGPVDNVSSCPPCHTNERETRELAQVCIDAAILLVETTRRTQSVGLLIQNMQLLKAWIFSACLVMGLSIFVELTFTETYSTCETGLSLQNGIGIIRDLDRTSPQAHRYLEVLTELRNALQTYRERLVPPRREGSGQFLSQIFVVSQEKSPPVEPLDSGTTPFASTTTAPPLSGDETCSGLWMSQQAAQATQSMGNMWRVPDESHTFDHVSLNGQPGGNEVLPFALGGPDINWNEISVQGTDNFLFEMEPFADMLSHFYNVTS